MLNDLIGKVIVLDLRGPFVCLGKLVSCDVGYLELVDADLHDLRDTDTTRENYVAAAKSTGIKRNRKRVRVVGEEIVAVSLLEDVVDE